MNTILEIGKLRKTLGQISKIRSKSSGPQRQDVTEISQMELDWFAVQLICSDGDGVEGADNKNKNENTKVSILVKLKLQSTTKVMV